MHNELGIPLSHGYAYTQFFAELGVMGFASITNTEQFEAVSKQIEADMRDPNNIITGTLDASTLTTSDN